MIKTFKILTYSDSKWSGGGVYSNVNYLQEMDVSINEFIKETGLKISSISHSLVNENIQVGTAEFNTQRNIYLYSTVFFT